MLEYKACVGLPCMVMFSDMPGSVSVRPAGGVESVQW